MHHLILLLPLAGIIVFWLMPLKYAIPSYIGIILVSGAMYWAVLRAIRKIPTTGLVSLVGTQARVVSRLGPKEDAQYTVEADGELWNADSPDQLEPGERVNIVRVDGLKLLVERTPSPASLPATNKTNA